MGVIDIGLHRGTLTVVCCKGDDKADALREALLKVTPAALATVTRTKVLEATASQERAFRHRLGW